MLDGIGDGRAFEAAMHHAVGAFLVIADAVFVPLGAFHQLLEGLHIAFAEQVTGLLPAEHAAQRHRPGRAFIGLVAGQEVHEQVGLGELPFLAAIAAAENVAEQLAGALAIEEVLLIGRALIGIAGRHRDAVQPHRHHLVEELGGAFRIGAVEQRAVDLGAEALGLRQLDRGDGLFVGAVLADRLVVHGLVAVEMDRPGEIRMRLVLVDLLGQQQRVGAQDHELVARDEALDDLRHLAMEQRLAAGDRHGRRAAFVDRFHALVIDEALVQDLVGIIDLAAAGAGQIAAEQRLQHQHQRIALAPHQVLLDDIGADARRLLERNTHCYSPFARAASPAAAGSGSQFGRQPERDVFFLAVQLI